MPTLLCMRTTLKLDDHVARAAKERAAAEGKTLSALIEESLRRYFRDLDGDAEPFELNLLTTKAKLQPGVDLSDRDALYDLMDPPA